MLSLGYSLKKKRIMVRKRGAREIQNGGDTAHNIAKIGVLNSRLSHMNPFLWKTCGHLIFDSLTNYFAI